MAIFCSWVSVAFGMKRNGPNIAIGEQANEINPHPASVQWNEHRGHKNDEARPFYLTRRIEGGHRMLSDVLTDQ